MKPPDQKEHAANTPENTRKTRLTEKLRENLRRRKEQARSRRDGAVDTRPEGLMKGYKDEPPPDR